MAPLYALLGALLLVVGLAAAIGHGGWSWLTPLVGLALTGSSTLVLYREPVMAGPRRRLRDLRHHLRHQHHLR